MGYKMKGFSGFGNSPVKQKERKNWENYGKGEGADVVKKSGLGPRETPGYTDLETTKPGQLMAFDLMGEMKKHVTKKMADKKVKTAYSTLKPKKKSGPLKQGSQHEKMYEVEEQMSYIEEDLEDSDEYLASQGKNRKELKNKLAKLTNKRDSIHSTLKGGNIKPGYDPETGDRDKSRDVKYPK
jgi:hypothetical protein